MMEVPLEWQAILLLICLTSVAIFVFFWRRSGSSLSHYIKSAGMRYIARKSIKTKDELLFQDPPSKEDCPICFFPMPNSGVAIGGVGSVYQSCCGKSVCSGCLAAVRDMEEAEMIKGKMKTCCPFCRVETATSDKEHIKRTKLRMKAGDANAFNILGEQYNTGG